MNLINNEENIQVIYVFLDFDGVINSNKFIVENFYAFKAPEQKTYYITEHIDPAAVARVNKIVNALNAQVVISTAWRKAFNLDRLGDILKSKGFAGEIVGETPIDPNFVGPRGLEIQQWMDSNGVKAEQIIILDDLDTMLHLKCRQVLTDFKLGLTDDHVDQAIRLGRNDY